MKSFVIAAILTGAFILGAAGLENSTIQKRLSNTSASKETQHDTQGGDAAATELLSQKIQTQLSVAEPVSKTEQQSLRGLPALTEAKLNDFDAQIDILKRDADDLDIWLTQHHVKQQLNSESLSPSLRKSFFEKLNELSKLRFEMIELRLKKVEVLDALVKSRTPSSQDVRS